MPYSQRCIDYLQFFLSSSFKDRGRFGCVHEIGTADDRRFRHGHVRSLLQRPARCDWGQCRNQNCTGQASPAQAEPRPQGPDSLNFLTGFPNAGSASEPGSTRPPFRDPPRRPGPPAARPLRDHRSHGLGRCSHTPRLTADPAGLNAAAAWASPPREWRPPKTCGRLPRRG